MRHQRSRNSENDNQSQAYWGYKMAPQPHHNYQGGHHADYPPHMRYAPHMGQVEPMIVPPMVFPYHIPPGQGHMYPTESGYPRGHYQHFVPLMHMPSGSPPGGGMALADGMEQLSLKENSFMVDDHHEGGKGGSGGMGFVQFSPKKGHGKVVHEEEHIPNANAGRVRTRKRRSRKSKDKQQILQENIKKTIYISDIDQLITEEQLATLFAECGVVVDCRVCGDPNSAMRFAFVEFMETAGAKQALEKNGCELGMSRLRVLPSKTAIVPVNKDLMPKTEEEMEQCSRTIYATNIDKKVDRDDVQRFFEALCGPVGKLRLLGDHVHSTRIAFVEFLDADSALAALSCSGALLGTMPIRVSPSKTPVRFSSQEASK